LPAPGRFEVEVTVSFAYPWWLGLLTVAAALLGGYVWLQRRRHRDVLRFTNLALLERVAPRVPGWTRHLPIGMLLLALGLQIVALAGPTAQARVPRNRATVVLVIDVSLSMAATDVTPTRLAAAQAAAKSFAEQLPAGINLGLVSFAGTAAVLVSPTLDHQQVSHAIDNLKLSESTATGEAIFAALQSIQAFSGGLAGGDDGPPPARIVLMSDGKQTLPGPDGENEPRGAFTAARQAAQAKIPISTIGFGTLFGTITLQGNPVPVPYDEPTMRAIADITGGTTFTASSEEELRAIYTTLTQQIGYETRQVDVSHPWLLAATVLSITGLTIAVRTGRRIP
jgi:Ca-activated chloride channel family protein